MVLERSQLLWDTSVSMADGGFFRAGLLHGASFCTLGESLEKIW